MGQEAGVRLGDNFNFHGMWLYELLVRDGPLHPAASLIVILPRKLPLTQPFQKNVHQFSIFQTGRSASVRPSRGLPTRRGVLRGRASQ